MDRGQTRDRNGEGSPQHTPNELRHRDQELEPDLRALDERLRRFASAEGGLAARGLADRIFEASVGGLPRVRDREPVFTARDRRWWAGFAGRSSLFPGRLAMAASLGLAFVLAAIVMRGAPALAEEPSTLAFLAEDPLQPYSSQLDPLLLTTEDLTVDDLRDEVATAIAQVGR